MTQDNSTTISSPWLIAFAVSIATFMEVLDTTITNVSLTHIAGNLSATQEESTWILTSYLVANGIILPLSGWLSGILGRKRFFILCITFFTLASFLCGAATSLGMLVVFRLIQGMAGGGLQPTQQAILLDTFPPEKRAQAFALTGITMIVAPVIGPTLGGIITDNFSWRWIFFINVPVGIAAILMVNKLLPHAEKVKSDASLSSKIISISLVAISLGSLQIILDKGQHEDWFESDFICTMAVISVVSLTAAVWYLLRQKEPIVDLRLLKMPSFGIACIMIFFTGFVLYSSSMLLPLLVQTQFGYDATLSGFILSPGGLVIIALMPFTTKLVNKVPAKYLVALGMLLCSTGMWYTMSFSPETDLHTFILMRISQVVGLPFLFVPISSIAFMNIPKHLNNKASALFSLFRNLGGSIGIALAATYFARHSQIWQNYLSEDSSAYNPTMQNAIALQEKLLQSGGIPDAMLRFGAESNLYREMLHQAALLAYMDSFHMMSIIMMILAPCTLLLPSNRPGKTKVDAAAVH